MVGAGLPLRVGRACFNYGVRQYGQQLGLDGDGFSPVASSTKLHAGAKAFADCSINIQIKSVRLEEEDDKVALAYRALSALLGTQELMNRSVIWRWGCCRKHCTG